QVYGWTPDGNEILFRSHRDSWDLGEANLFTVDKEGGLPARLPMPGAGAGAISPDGSKVLYSPLFRDFRHWKRYEGGWAQNLWIYDTATDTARQLTEHKRTERDPMWIGDRVYFSADWTGTLQLYGVDPASGAVDQLTDHDVWDVRWPSADETGDQIVYELAGALQILDLSSASSRSLSITVPSDQVMRRSRFEKVDDLIRDVTVAPGGKRVVFAARGDLYSVPVERGPVRNLTRSSGAFDQEPAWSPDGRTLAFVSDRDGEQEIWRVDQDGHGEPEQLTDGHETTFSGLRFSPDGRSLAFRDAAARLYVLDMESHDVRQVADDETKFGLDYRWSPHGGHLVFSLAEATGFRSIHLWSRSDDRTRRLTSDRANDFSPAFGAHGDYLYFLSDRQYQPQIGTIEFNYSHNRKTYIYALALRDDVGHPFPPRSDEVDIEDEAAKGETKDDAETSSDGENDDKGDDGEGDAKTIEIDFDGLEGRLARVPVDADNLGGLLALDDRLLYARLPNFYYGRAPSGAAELVAFDVEKRKAETVVSGFQGGDFSPDGQHLLARVRGSWQLFETREGAKGATVSTAKLGAEIDPVEEWRQIFDDAWRRFRDFFYVENMHGYDWPAIRERYRPLLQHVAHRSDLNYLISEMIAELNVSHAYVAGGDLELPERPTVPLLGARLEFDDEVGAFRVSQILQGDNAEPNYRSPLTEIGVDIEVGDHVLAIDGQRLDEGSNPYEVLRGADSNHVELSVSGSADAEPERVIVRPIRSEDDLFYLSWIERNRQIVAEATDGRVGYLHIPDMGGAGIREWIKHFYPQIGKEGLVIDVRSNGGGNISPMLIERLERSLAMVDFERHTDHTETVPNRTFIGHMVCLINETTASDGDQFAWVFRNKGLGPLIGKR
ncbi:MAG: PDZ domain-containing protein, partial [Acidobacteriota bacterium]